MKRIMLASLLVITAGATGVMAQKGNQKGDAASASGPKIKSKAEATAFQAMVAAQQNPDEEIKAAEDFADKFADSDFKDIAYFLEANAYQAKKDPAKAQIYAQRAADANPKNFQADILVAELITRSTRENDLDRDDKLAKADKASNDAIAALSTAQKPNPQLSDQDWEKDKKDLTARAHDLLGTSAMTRKKYDDAITHFKQAVDGAADPEPAYKVRLATAYDNAGQYDQAITMAESVMNDDKVPQVFKQFAQSVRASAVVAKRKKEGGAAAPATPGAPGTAAPGQAAPAPAAPAQPPANPK